MANPNPEDEITAERRVYDYDNIGNRQSFTAAAGDPLYYCANKLNQYDYTDETTSCPPSQPTDSFDYDGDGNLIDDGTFEYSWDAENRLIELATRVELGEDEEDYDEGDKKLQFAYDYMGRRVRKTAWTYNGSTWVEDTDRLFVYDGWNVVLVLDANDSNVTLTKYTWGLDVSGTLGGAGGIGGLLSAEETQGTSETSDDKRYWFFHDANGNVTQILDATNLGGTITLAAHCEYDPYGHTIVANDVNESGYVDDNPFRFSTKWLDTELAASAQTGAIGETGLYYYGYRYYSPTLGREVSPEVIRLLGALNRYQSLLNNIAASAKSGHSILVVIGLSGAGIAFVLCCCLPNRNWRRVSLACVLLVMASIPIGFACSDEQILQAKEAELRRQLDRLKSEVARNPWASDAIGWGGYVDRLDMTLSKYAVLVENPADQASWSPKGLKILGQHVAPTSIVHEGTHAIDYEAGGPGRTYFEGRGQEREAEGVAYAGEVVYFFFSKLVNLEHAIDRGDCDGIVVRWEGVWGPIQPCNVDDAGDSKGRFKLGPDDFIRFLQLSGVRISCRELREKVKQFAKEKGCPCVDLACDMAPDWAK